MNKFALKPFPTVLLETTNFIMLKITVGKLCAAAKEPTLVLSNTIIMQVPTLFP